MSKYCDNDECSEQAVEQDDFFDYCVMCGQLLTEVEDEDDSSDVS